MTIIIAPGRASVGPNNTMYSGDITVGLRVVRGSDWQSADQDGGEGCVGTVVEFSGLARDKPVVVIWDTGVRASYRAGYQGKYDLRVLDNASAGSVSNRQFYSLHRFKLQLSSIFGCAT